MRIGWAGPIRLLLTASVAAALVTGAGASTRTLDLSRLGPPWALPTTSEVAAAATATSRMCVGPELVGLAGVADVTQPVTVAAGRAPGRALSQVPSGPGQLQVSLAGADRSLASVAAPADDRAVSVTVTTSGAQPVVASGTGSLAPGLAASQWWSTDSPTLRGLVEVPCAPDGDDLWLIAGGGDPGRQERLVLANPGANEVSVDVSVFGANGPVKAPNGRGVIVPGRGRTSMLLDALAPGEASPVVRLHVRGGTVAAVLTDTWLDGAVAAGADSTPPTAAPAERQVIPGVDLTQAGRVRVGVPGDTQAVVSVRVLTASGGAPLPGGGVQTIAAGATAEIPLSDLPAGIYGIEVVADAPVVAAAFAQAREGSAVGEFAWTPATTALSGVAGVTLGGLAEGGSRRLALVSSANPTVVSVFTGTPSDPLVQRVTLDADRVTTVDVPATETSVWLVAPSDSSVRAAVIDSTGSGATRLMASAPLVQTVTSTASRAAYPLP